MALRVLLADESSTIKKVMQLALQDFGIEVKSVPIGLDVIQVARSFQPDVIFADVLLSKRSGYEVAADVKADPILRAIPVILMWSGFMEIDEARARASGAERRLEKPFDADHLRSLVKDVVPRLNENHLSDYLAFPDLPDIVETPMEEAPPQISQAPLPRTGEPIPRGQYAPTQAQYEARQKQQQQQQQAPTHAAPRPASAPPPQQARAQTPTAQAPASARGPVAPTAPRQNPAPPQARPSAPNLPPRQTANPQANRPAPPPARNENEDSAFAGFVSLNPDLEDPDDFQQVPLPGSKTLNLFETRRDDEDWRQGGLEQFRVTPQDQAGYDSGYGAPDFGEPDNRVDLANASVAMTDGVENIALDEIEDLTLGQSGETPHPGAPARPTQTSHQGRSAASVRPAPASDYATLDPLRAEEVLREQVREVLETIAWKIIPDIAERIVREEIQKLLREAERLS